MKIQGEKMKKKYLTVEFLEAEFEKEELQNKERKNGYLVFEDDASENYVKIEKLLKKQLWSNEQIESVLDKFFPEWNSQDSYIKVKVEEKEIQLHIDNFKTFYNIALKMEELEQFIAFCKEQNLSFKLEATSLFCFTLKLVKK